MSVLDLARPELVALAGYSSARMEASAGRIWLNANESPWAQTAAQARDLNRYPEPQPQALIERLAEVYGVRADQVFVGRGSDEAIDLLTRGFCAAGASNVIISPPTFGMYAVAANIQGAAIVSVPLMAESGFSYPMAEVLQALDEKTRLVYLCRPNNPTGNLISLDEVEQMARATAGRALLVVDEAYIEFAVAPSATGLLDRYEHLVVLRTLSKAHALAAARIGVALAAPSIIGLLRRIVAPYPLPQSCVTAALAALSPLAVARSQENIRRVCEQRERLRTLCATLPTVLSILASEANFLTLRLHNAAAAYAALSAAGIIVRSLARYPGLENALRVTVGTETENFAVVAVLKSLGAQA